MVMIYGSWMTKTRSQIQAADIGILHRVTSFSFKDRIGSSFNWEEVLHFEGAGWGLQDASFCIFSRDVPLPLVVNSRTCWRIYPLWSGEILGLLSWWFSPKPVASVAWLETRQKMDEWMDFGLKNTDLLGCSSLSFPYRHTPNTHTHTQYKKIKST